MALADRATPAPTASTGELFPPSPRVIYAKAPLTQVVCQLRFPRLLKIETEAPADFQERVRDMFPLLERLQPQIQDLPPEIAQAMGLAVPVAGNFAFKTEDGKTTLTLTPDHIALSTNRYDRWEEYCRCFEPALAALVDLYRPSFFQRIGLRYINVIERSALKLEDAKWSTLLNDHVLGELSAPLFEENATDVKRSIRVGLPDNPDCAVYLQHGFAKKANSPEIVYRLDFDFYKSSKTEVSDAKATLDRLNAMVGRAFRWCITKPLHDRLGPTELELDQRG